MDNQKLNTILLVAVIAAVGINAFNGFQFNSTASSFNENTSTFMTEGVGAAERCSELSLECDRLTAELRHERHRRQELEGKYNDFRMWVREMFAARTGQGQTPPGSDFPGEMPPDDMIGCSPPSENEDQ